MAKDQDNLTTKDNSEVVDQGLPEISGGSKPNNPSILEDLRPETSGVELGDVGNINYSQEYQQVDLEQEVNAVAAAEMKQRGRELASVSEVAKATFYKDSTFAFAANLAHESTYGLTDPEFDAADYVFKQKKEWFEKLSSDDREYVVNNARNAVHANSLGLRRAELRKTRELQADRPWTTAAVLLADGMATGSIIAGAPRLAYLGAKSFKIARVAHAVSKANQSRKFRTALGASEGAVFGQLEARGSVSGEDNTLLYMALGGTLENLFGKAKMPEIIKRQKVNRKGEVTEEYGTKGSTVTQNMGRSFSDFDAEDAAGKAFSETDLTLGEMRVADEARAIDDAAVALDNKATSVRKRLDREEVKIESLKGTIGKLEESRNLAQKNLKAAKKRSRIRKTDIEEASQRLPKSAMDDLDDFINKKEAEIASKTRQDVDTIRNTSGFDDLMKISGRLKKAPRELDAARKIKNQEEISQQRIEMESRVAEIDGKIEKTRRSLAGKEANAAKKRKQLEETENSLESARAKVDELSAKNPAQPSRKAPYIYDSVVRQARQLEGDFGKSFSEDYDFRIAASSDDLEDTLAYAKEQGDEAIVSRIQREVDRREAQRSQDVSEGKSIFGSVDAFLQDMGQRSSRYSTGVRNTTSRLVTSTQRNADNSVVEHGADHYMQNYLNSYLGELGTTVSKNYSDFLKEINKDNWFRRFYAPNSSKRTQFDSDVVTYMHETQNNMPPIRKYPKSVINAGEELKGLVGRARKQAIDNGFEVSEDAIEDLTKSALSRAPDKGAWMNGARALGLESIGTMFARAILKADPSMNLRVTLKNLELRAAKGEDLADEMAELSEEIRKVDSDPAYAARHIEEQMNSESATYSSTLGRAYAYNNYERAANNSDLIPDRGGDGAWDALMDLGEPVLARMSNEERALMQTIAEYRSKNSKISGVDVFKRRLDMDTTIVAQVEDVDGVLRNISPVDFFDKSLEQVMSRSLSLYASSAGLAKKGVRSFEQLDSELNAARKAASNEMNVSRANAAQSDIEMIRKHFKVESQYDDTGALNQVKRIAKKFAAAAKLGYLPIAMSGELANTAARNGLGTTLRNMPSAVRMAKDVVSQRPGQSGLSRAFYMSGLEQLRPFDNYLMNMDNGVYQTIGGKSKDFGIDVVTTQSGRFLNSAERVASTAAHTFVGVSKPMDLFLRRMSAMGVMDNMLNASVDTLRSQRYVDAGVTEELIGSMDVARKYFTRENGVITDFDYEGFKSADPVAYDDFIASTVRLSDRQIMNSKFGQMSPLLNTQMFSWFGQFKSFALGTYNTQFKYDASLLDQEMLMAWTAQIFTGMAAAYTRESARSALEDRENRMKDMSLAQLSVIGFRESGMLALATMMLDTVAETITGKSFVNQYSTTQQRISPMIFTQIQELTSAFPQLMTSIVDPGTEVGREQVEGLLGLFVPHWAAVPASRMAQEATDMPDKTKSEEDSLLKMIEFDSLE